MIPPKWTVFCNILSPENDKWVGTCWEFFDEEKDAQKCYDRHVALGHVTTKRPWHRNDWSRMGAAHHHLGQESNDGKG